MSRSDGEDDIAEPRDYFSYARDQLPYPMDGNSDNTHHLVVRNDLMRGQSKTQFFRAA
jgi:hypothetical protein